MNCKNCGAPLDEGALFCRKCGTAAPNEPESKPKKRVRAKSVFSAAGAWFAGAFAWMKDRFTAIKNAGIRKNKRFLLVSGAALALLIVLIVVIACAASCGAKKTSFKTADDVIAAAVDALEKGDGERLRTMTAASEKLLGAHPEVFGEGKTPEAVMAGYYTRLADGFRAKLTERYGKDAKLGTQLVTTTLTGTEIFETNRALGLDAAEYVTVTGTFTVNGETVPDAELYLVAANVDGEWKLIVLYVD